MIREEKGRMGNFIKTLMLFFQASHLQYAKEMIQRNDIIRCVTERRVLNRK